MNVENVEEITEENSSPVENAEDNEHGFCEVCGKKTERWCPCGHVFY
jgi:hypothetical protein